MLSLKKMFVLFYLFALFAGGDVYSETKSSLTKIKCDLKPIERIRANEDERKILPHIHLHHGTSLNWSGYAAATNLNSPLVQSVSSVSGSWTIPTVIASQSSSTYSSMWVGIDGFTSGTVEQIGTESDWRNGGQHNYVWFEMYPLGAFEIVGFPINVGDVFSASVSYVGNSVFRLVISNLSVGVSYVVPKRYTTTAHAKRNSAEWIVEAPFLNGVLPLADFGVASFTHCSATINNVTGSINNSHWQHDSLTMTTATNVVKALPSALSGNGSSFTITWEHE